MIELKPDTSVFGFWFVRVISPGANGDWMCCLLKQKDEPWKAQYRFRWYVDNKFHGSDDRKSWMVIDTKNEFGDAPRDLIDVLHLIAGRIAAMSEEHAVNFVEVDGSSDKAIDLLRNQDFVHIDSTDPVVN